MRKTSLTPAPRSAVKLVRCAIYTRKSTEEGLDQEFNSRDAQRESAEAYVRSQAEDGWAAVPDRYDDGGFTGENTDRPALRRLMADVDAGRVDCAVVYTEVHRMTSDDTIPRGFMQGISLLATLARCYNTLGNSGIRCVSGKARDRDSHGRSHRFKSCT
ncbi:MAG TPA: recombinase family protein, partial [Urbifossiella sp.]|nr:recombinase family protein [Urbifossiella sp.]